MIQKNLLIIDDEDMFRRMTMRKLMRAGSYHIAEASGVQEAVNIMERDGLKLDLILADVILNDGTGKQAAHEIARRRGRIPTLFMSGYPREIAIQRELIDADDFFIKKAIVPTQIGSIITHFLSKTAKFHALRS